ncbi:MAG: hypothetical protein JW807_13465 [Spirochaetes bacterium]|nr:hypothetical protein [Spirochaetota bacterium]
MDRFKIISALLVSLFVVVPRFAAAADHVFLKNGIILEGRVVDETDIALTILLKDGKKQVVARNNMLRTLYNNSYKVKQFIQLKNGDIIEGYIVAEDRDSYTLRKDLASAREFVYAKSQIEGVSKRRPDPLNLRPETPRGLLASYRFFMPLTAPTKTYVKFYHGASLDYTGAITRIVSIYGGGVFLYGKGDTSPEIYMSILGPMYRGSSGVTSFINSYYIGARFGYLVSAFFYPYASVAAKGTWFRYAYGGSAKDYPGVGADVSAGLAFTIEKKVSLFFEFQGQWGMLIDKNKTDLSGIGAGFGLMAIF